MRMNTRIISCLLGLLLFAGFAVSLDAQVTIPDPGLNAAVREALQKPVGPLTQSDLLNLNVLSACCRDIKNLQGLEAAQNLRILDLHSNSLTNGALINSFTNLQIIDLFQNRLSSFTLSSARSNLTVIDIAFNSLTQCSLPNGLTNLDTIFLEGNQLTNFSLPTGLSRLTQLDLSGNSLSSFTFPPDLTNLTTALVFANQLTNVTLPGTLRKLGNLDLDFNQLKKFSLPSGLGNLLRLTVFRNLLTNLVLPPDMTKLGFLDVGDNQLTGLTLPFNLGQMSFLRVSGNKLSTLVLPEGMTNLTAIFARSNQLTSLSLPSGLTQLVQIDVIANHLTNLTLRPDMTQLVTLGVEGNPLTTLVLSEPSAATNLAGTVTILRNQGVSVLTYPLAVQIVRPLVTIGAFKIGIKGPPGVYSVLASTNLTAWAALGVASNPLGSVNFTDVTANAFPNRFYRTVLQSPPTNMVFIPSNTFTMGSPTNEMDRTPFEGPQATVTLTHAFWIGKYEVTQGEYLDVMGDNPSNFPGDLSRPASGMNWFEATNYCAKLTQRARTAGRIAPGTKYRLPTEAEWECAARAGTTTRFSYGNDPDYSSLTNYAWFLDFQILDLIVHPVGQKLPNSWGLYDMAGHVWEWCQDNYGQQTGAIQVDPTGPPPSANAEKVIRGGAYDYPDSSCRSASRFFRTAFWPDTDVGFRVVLVTEP
jgi:formylglycine-generating enzyme required for sulfatase activity